MVSRIQIMDEKNMGTRNNIKNQSRKLQDMIGRQQTNIPEMY
jgi:hypothetical protein